MRMRYEFSVPASPAEAFARWRAEYARLYRLTFLSNPVGRAAANLTYLPGSTFRRVADSLRDV